MKWDEVWKCVRESGKELWWLGEVKRKMIECEEEFERICQAGRKKKTAERKLDGQMKGMTAEENGWNGENKFEWYKVR